MSNAKYPTESIYNLLPKKESGAKVKPRYVSKFRPTVVQESKLTKDAMRTMGPAKVELPSPDKYLKKHSKESKPLEVTGCSKDTHRTCTYIKKKPPIPSRTENPLIHTKRDFIKTATAKPKKPQPVCVDTNTGHKQPLENSGLVPKYIKKKNLKKDWDNVHREYQSLPFIINTMSQKAYKVQLEEEMKCREKNISLFESFTTLYISKD